MNDIVFLLMFIVAIVLSSFYFICANKLNQCRKENEELKDRGKND